MSEEHKDRTHRKAKWWASTVAQLLAVTVLSALIGGVLASHYDGQAVDRAIWLVVAGNIVLAWYAGMFYPIIKGGRFDHA